MTRQEEIQNLIDEETGIDNYGSLDYQIGVCDGVRLADKTMIDKACEWIKKEVLDDYQGVIWDNIVEDFRKAMEE